MEKIAIIKGIKSGLRLAYVYMLLPLSLIAGVLAIIKGHYIGYFILGCNTFTLSVAIWANWHRIQTARLVLQSDEYFVLTHNEYGADHRRKYMPQERIVALEKAFMEKMQQEANSKQVQELIKK